MVYAQGFGVMLAGVSVDGFDELVRNGESEAVEFKSNFDKEAVETAVAFANTNGGIILVGVSDEGKIVGTSVGRESLSVWVNQISQVTEPAIIPDAEVKVVEGKTVVLIRVHEFPIKPVSVKGRCYRRVGNSNRLLSPREIAELHLESIGGSWDARVALGESVKGLDLQKIREYARNANIAGRRKTRGEKPIEVLKKIGLIKDEKPTWASILLFGKNPHCLLPQASLHCGRFKGETLVIDDRMIEGPIIGQIDEGMDFIRKNINVEFVMTGEPKRKEVWDYPLEALREALINAVCHRDYSFPSNTEIRIYEDELVVLNPGGLPFGVTLEDLYKNHKSIPRNKEIASVFYDMGVIEKWGSGIKKIRDACKNAGTPQPKFEERQNGFNVTFKKRAPSPETLEKIPQEVTGRLVEKLVERLAENQKRILALMEQNPCISKKELSKKIGISTTAIDKNIAKLKKKRLLKRVGPDKGGRWQAL